ncbi:MAG: hypothetical protein Q4D56_04275 [Bacteroides sp.]|nr:hypothetical protein [Bacteroides sp.]
MILFKTISSFRHHLSELLKVRRKVYAGVSDEINREFKDKSIDHIRQNNDMILIEGDLVVIKLRLPDKKQHLSKKDGFRLIYLVSKVDSLVVFLDIYPKNSPLQQLDIDDAAVKRLITEFIEEGEADKLEDMQMK